MSAPFPFSFSEKYAILFYEEKEDAEMSDKPFAAYAATPENPMYGALTQRLTPLYERESMRDPFYRDYTRILHSTAFRRLKHKTQVFPHVESDHICTRMEHVLHVESVSHTIAEALGLSTHLTRAIALGHDIGHPPFGHEGERVLSGITLRYLGESFWHEQNGLRFADHVELLEDPWRVEHNLCLTYAVRDGIISHCGELDDNGLRPRKELFDLSAFTSPGKYQSATWEGCVVKISDKIAYLGRDIEDADTLGFLGEEGRAALTDLQSEFGIDSLNTTGIMHAMICDICAYSTPERGITLSPRCAALMQKTKEFNYRYIYSNSRFAPFIRYADLVLNEVFEMLRLCYTGKPYTAASPEMVERYPTLVGGFVKYVRPYMDQPLSGYDNEKIYGDLTDERLYLQAAVDYISGMTDAYLIRAYGDLVNF
jgi:dGTPase